MKKITELTEMARRIVHYRDEYGNIEIGTQEYEVYRVVKGVSEGPRFAHLIIDSICFQVVIYVVDYVFQLVLNLTEFDVTINLTFGLVAGIILLLLYPALYAFSEYKWQKTLGKYLTKSIVIDEYGNKPELRAIVLRSLVRIVPFEPLSCLGVPSRGWHDRWSKTWVVSEKELAAIKRIQAEQSALS